MAKSVYWHNCIREIRNVVFGRDARKPIADALTEIQPEIEAASAEHNLKLTQIKRTMQEKVSSLNDDSYRSFSGGSAQLISGVDYTLNL